MDVEKELFQDWWNTIQFRLECNLYFVPTDYARVLITHYGSMRNWPTLRAPSIVSLICSWAGPSGFHELKTIQGSQVVHAALLILNSFIPFDGSLCVTRLQCSLQQKHFVRAMNLGSWPRGYIVCTASFYCHLQTFLLELLLHETELIWNAIDTTKSPQEIGWTYN